MSVIKMYDIKQFNVTSFKKYSCNIHSIHDNLVLPLPNDFVYFLPNKITIYYDNRTAKIEKYNKKYYFTRLMIAHKNYLDNKKEMSFSILNLIESKELPYYAKLDLSDNLTFIVKEKKCPCCKELI
jgi:hypothetical protein